MARKRKSDDREADYQEADYAFDRSEDSDFEEPEVVAPVIVSPKIPFSTWFDRQVKAGRVKAHQSSALLVFFKKQGLKESGSVEDYNSAFARF